MPDQATARLSPSQTGGVSGPRKEAILALSERVAQDRDRWVSRNAYYYAEDSRMMRFLIPEGRSVLEIGCGTGRLLAALKPARGVGIDFSPSMIEIARQAHPDLRFIIGDAESSDILAEADGPFDFIVLSDTFGLLDDCQVFLSRLRALTTPATRLIIAHHNHLWEPLLRTAELLGLKMPQTGVSWLSERDIANLLGLGGFDVVQTDRRQILPRHAFGVGPALNRYIGTLPGMQRLCIRGYIVARPSPDPVAPRPDSATVIVPCRNECGNIAPLLARLPSFCEHVEIIFVEGHSRDGTYEEIERLIAANPDRTVKAVRQDGIGKADAVRKGVALATGEIVLILDADMTVAPEDTAKVFDAIAGGTAEFVNGTRFVYPMEGGAMRFLNLIGNRVFSWIFSWLLNRRLTDTLCGTKALRREHWIAILEERKYFGAEDPFGDFDLILGASRLLLKTVEIPLRYAGRSYGETQISRFLHGWYLLRMAFVAYRRLKAFG
jgi:SAM-dependent methyltransferase